MAGGTIATHPAGSAAPTAWLVIAGLGLCHLLNDVMQSLLAAIYPLLQAEFALAFWQIGLMTFAFMVTASVLQPVVGWLGDRRVWPAALPVGMGATLAGVVLLATATAYPALLAGAGLIGVGSAIFHPEASRVARAASGGRFGTAQSLFQFGGTTGTAIGPLAAAFIVVPLGRPSLAWFAVMALIGMVILQRAASWHAAARRAAAARTRVATEAPPPLPGGRLALILGVLLLLVIVKNAYTASISSYYIFFLIDRFGISTQDAQLMLFAFLAAAALGVALGGIIGDRVGARTVIWFSILGALPFTLALPHLPLVWTGVASVLGAAIMACAFPAIIVYAQALLPGRVGMVAGLFFGFAFGSGGIAAALLGVLADARGIGFVFLLCSVLPVLGLLTAVLPPRRDLATG